MTDQPQDAGARALQALAFRYLDGKLSAEQVQALRDRLINDAESAKAFVEVVQLVALVREQALREQGIREELALPSDSAVRSGDVLEELLRLEQQAVVVSCTGAIQPAGQHTVKPTQSSLVWGEVAGATSYLLKNAAKSSTGRWGAIAAVLLLAATLFFVFTGGGEDPTPPLVIDGPVDGIQNETPAPFSQPVVATLTAERDALWDRRPGEDLYAGQRFTLSAGFAEITTNDGAVAILEAPATIEMIASPNAMRLVAGKLVGICETDSSKGFLVRTPHMDVTDLGTRFGVDASSPVATEVHVYTGAVEAVRSGTASTHTPAPERLVAGESARAWAGDTAIARIDHDTSRFAAITMRTIQLPGSGQGLDTDDIDPNWRIVAIDGAQLAKAIDLKVSRSTGHTLIRKNDPLRGQWLAHEDQRTTVNEEDRITYTVQTEIVVPAGIDLDRTLLEVACFFDNDLSEARINNRPAVDWIASSVREDPWRLSGSLRALGMRHGTNTVQFDIDNRALSPVGLYTEWQLVGYSSLADEQPGDQKQ